MIHVENEATASAKTISELFDRLAVYQGQTLMVKIPAKARTQRYAGTYPGVEVGALHWLRLVDGSEVIRLYIGKEISERGSTSELVDLTYGFSVLAAGEWRTIHVPTETSSEIEQPRPQTPHWEASDL